MVNFLKVSLVFVELLFFKVEVYVLFIEMMDEED